MEQIASQIPDYPLQAHATSGVIKVYPPTNSEGPSDQFFEVVQGTLRPLVATEVEGHLTMLSILSMPDSVKTKLGRHLGLPSGQRADASDPAAAPFRPGF